MKLFLSIFTLLLISAGVTNLTLNAVAGEHDHHHGHDHDDHDHDHDHEDRIEHYSVEEPESEAEALTLLKKKFAAVEAVMLNSELNDSDLEAIHEISYSLEAAVDALRDYQQDEQIDALDMLDEAVQALHYASENHDVAKTKAWFEKLGTAKQEVINAF